MKKILVLFITFMSLLMMGCGDNNNKEIPSTEVITTEVSLESMTDYEQMMYYVNQLKIDYEREQVFELLGYPDRIEGSGIGWYIYKFGEYDLEISDELVNLMVEIYNNKTGERFRMNFEMGELIKRN